MKLSVDMVEEAFRALRAQTRSREDVADWASAVAAEDEAGTVTYQPPSDRLRIWQALSYLRGVDLRDAPDRYLHTPEDFETFIAAWRGPSHDKHEL